MNGIAILDFGSQYTQLIARRLRESNVYCEILPYNVDASTINAQGIIFSGGPASVYAQDAYKPDPKIYDLNLPILGICYGMQVVVDHFGGRVAQSQKQEYGRADIEVNFGSNIIFASLHHRQDVWMSHADKVIELPKGFVKLAHSNNAEFVAIADKERKIYGLQFHPEVTQTSAGKQMLKNFALSACEMEASWTMSNFLQEKTKEIQDLVSSKKVLCAVSGGVDSSVTAALISKAIGENCISVFIDHGLLRKDEAKLVEDALKSKLGINLITIDAKEQFLSALKGVTNPEQKRKIIGKTFIDVFEQEAKKHEDVAFLAQGTLYPDVIESVSAFGPSKTIKSHHNVGGLPETMKLDLVEPLKELFKDEVRSLGRQMDLSQELLMRHPFPGPGLAVRIMGEVDEQSCDILRQADAIFLDCLKSHDLYNKIWQAFAVLLNTKSVGVMGDNRTYERAVALRAVNSIDGMTASFYPFDMSFLEHVSRRIINEVAGINRVVYDISSKPPSTIEWE